MRSQLRHLLIFLSMLTAPVISDLSPQENIQRSLKCGQPNRYSLSAKPRTPFRWSPNLSYVLISPRHFLISSKYLKGFDKEKCLSRNTTSLLANVQKATFLGECEPKPSGFLLAEHKDPIGSTMFACLPEKPLTPGEEVKVRADKEYSNVKVVKCKNPTDKLICLDTVVRDFRGSVYKGKTVYGMAFGNSESQLEAWSLYEFRDKICETSGICQVNTTTSGESSEIPTSSEVTPTHPKTSSKSPESRIPTDDCDGGCMYDDVYNSSTKFITLITTLLIALIL